MANNKIVDIVELKRTQLKEKLNRYTRAYLSNLEEDDLEKRKFVASILYDKIEDYKIRLRKLDDWLEITKRN